MTKWKFLHPQMTMMHLGFLPLFLSEDDPDDAVSQIHKRYIGGWRDFNEFKMRDNGVLTYPGDPPLAPLAWTTVRMEIIYFYQYEWVSVVQPDGSFRVARID